MEEHIIVFDKHLKAGKGLSVFYDIKVFDVPAGEKAKIIEMLSNLGFLKIRDGEEGKPDGKGTIISEKRPCILAKYFGVETNSEYHIFWEKKEEIELTIDKL